MELNRIKLQNKFGQKTGNIIYSMRYRSCLPISIIAKTTSINYYKLQKFLKKFANF